MPPQSIEAFICNSRVGLYRTENHGTSSVVQNSYRARQYQLTRIKQAKIPKLAISGAIGLQFLRGGFSVACITVRSVVQENQGGSLRGEEVDEEEDDLCPVECVREFNTDEEFTRILEKAKETKSLVVVDFYRTSCGSCKYIEQGFSKLCKGAGDEEAPVIFLKHNVLDEYDEQSEVAERLRIKTVPLFHFYKGGVLLEAFPTRDKEKITEAIQKYSSPAT